LECSNSLIVNCGFDEGSIENISWGAAAEIHYNYSYTKLIYTEKDGTWEVTGFNGSDNDNTIINIPDFYKGKKVTSIDWEAFKGSNICGIVLNDNITTIQAKSF
jgi:hypothetical protein